MEKLMGLAPHILDPWTKLEDTFFASGTFSPALLEQVRRTLALATGCHYCQAKGGPPDHSHADSRTAAAVELAEHFARDHRSIDEVVLSRARDHFADAELCELIMFMGFMWAGGTFGAVLGLEPLHSISDVGRHRNSLEAGDTDDQIGDPKGEARPGRPPQSVDGGVKSPKR